MIALRTIALPLLAAVSAVPQQGIGFPEPVDQRFAPPVERVEQVVRRDYVRFADAYQVAWRASQLDERQRGVVVPSRAAGAVLHCHDASATPWQARLETVGTADSMSTGARARQITSAYHLHRLCPFWLVSAASLPRDERQDPDAALLPAFRSVLRDARAQLLLQLQVATRQHPESRFLTGLRLRLAVDQGDTAAVRDVAAVCAAEAAWCGLLRAYAIAYAGDMWAAQRAFHAVEDAPWLCEVYDLALLPSDAERVPRGARRCARDAALRERLWWVSRPFLEDTVPAREVAHHRRGVEAMLHRLTPQLERTAVYDSTGGDAWQDLRIRYGAPALMTALGIGAVDQEHSGYLVRLGLTGPVQEPYPTYEYPRRMVSVVPSWAAIREPFTAPPTAWQLTPPRDEYGQEEPGWFPQELWDPPVPMIALHRGQAVTLRRQDGAHHAAVVRLDANGLRRPAGGAIEQVRVLSSPSPNTVVRRGVQRAVVQRPFVARADLPPEPTLLGVEFDHDPRSGAPAGVGRWGVVPPLPLRVLPAGRYDISVPVLIAPPDAPRAARGDPDAALPTMLDGHHFTSGSRIGVYWETYGIAPGDTVELAFWVERVTPQTPLRQLGVALRVATDLNTPVAVSWREPDSGRSSFVFGEGVPIVARAIALDLSSLTTGAYRLEVAVARPGEPAVRGRTEIHIAR